MRNIKNYLIEEYDKHSEWIVRDRYGEIHFKILPYLSDIEKGFFVEAGAFDGLHQSNTKILEDCGWKGILIEPSIDRCHDCIKNRTSNSKVYNCALVSNDYTEDTVYGLFGSPVSKVERDFNKLIENKQNFQSVEARTLTSILLENEIKHVDFLSLDMEGYELEALKGLDFKQIGITYILVEHNRDSYSLEELNEFLLSNGYINIRNISNFTFDTPGWGGNHQDYLYKNFRI